MSAVSTKDMCKEIANFFLLHGLKIRLQDIVSGKKRLEYSSLSEIVPNPILEIGGSIVPYSFGKESNRFYLAESSNRLGIVDTKMNRFYSLNSWNDENIKIAEKFSNLMRKENLTEEEQDYVWGMYIALPICEWASQTSYDLFKLRLWH